MSKRLALLHIFFDETMVYWMPGVEYVCIMVSRAKSSQQSERFESLCFKAELLPVHQHHAKMQVKPIMSVMECAMQMIFLHA